MSIRTDGIVSGIKTSALISELSSSISKPKVLLESKVSTIQRRQTAYANLNTLLGNMQTSLEDIQEISDFRSFSSTIPSTASDYFSIETTGEATAGTYSIQTTNLAESERFVMNSFSDSDSDAPINDGTLTLTWVDSDGDGTSDSGFSDISVTISEANGNNTLGTLASSLDKEEGISSYVMYDGSGYRLVVQGENTGSDYAFDLSYSASGTGDTDLSVGSTQDAEDATITLNGITGVSSNTNVFSDAVNGLTITALGNMSDDSVTAKDVTVALDISAVSEKVEAFVTSYNAVIDYIARNSKFDEDAGVKGVFVGDASARGVINRIRSIVSEQYSSLTDANSSDVTLDSLSVLGITFSTDVDGTLSFDADTFQDAVEDYQLDVEAMFGDDADSFSTAMVDALEEYVDPLTGIIKKLDDNLDTQIEGLEDQIERWESRIESYEARLFKQFTQMEKIAGSMQTTGSFLTSFFSTDS